MQPHTVASSARLHLIHYCLIVLGLTLPYIVGVGSIVLYRNQLVSIEYYESGGWALWHERSFFATILAGLIGTLIFAAGAWPFTHRFAWGKSLILTIVLFTGLANTVAALTVRFVAYLMSGAIQ
jgi:uncharacterized membrane protein